MATNRQRAAWAERALDTFTRETYGGRSASDLRRDDRTTAIYDLVTDLLHYARLNRVKADDILANARRQYDHESAFRFDQETD